MLFPEQADGIDAICGLLNVARPTSERSLSRIFDCLVAPVAQDLSAWPSHLLRTLTFDNGKEFAEHGALAAAPGMDMFFAKPYCAWQRGTNDNTNGLVRQYLPKGTKPQGSIATARCPRKRLGYLTPSETLAQNAARHGAFGD